MEQQPDLHREQRETVLQIFAAAGKSDFNTGESQGIAAAFNKAASFIENTPGIVEYVNWNRQRNLGTETDGTNFRSDLLTAAQRSANFDVRARAVECLGNISTRHFDFVCSLYDLEQISRIALLGPTAAVKGAALQAFAKIATTRTLRETNPTVQHFQVYGTQAYDAGGKVDFRSAVFPHYKLSPAGESRYDSFSRITYIEAAIGLAAHVAGKSPDVEARRLAAETLRFIAKDRQEDRFSDYRDPRSLVFNFVQALKARETDAVVLGTYKKILETDPQLAEKQRAKSISELADTLGGGSKKPGAHGFML